MGIFAEALKKEGIVFNEGAKYTLEDVRLPLSKYIIQSYIKGKLKWDNFFQKEISYSSDIDAKEFENNLQQILELTNNCIDNAVNYSADMIKGFLVLREYEPVLKILESNKGSIKIFKKGDDILDFVKSFLKYDINNGGFKVIVNDEVHSSIVSSEAEKVKMWLNFTIKDYDFVPFVIDDSFVKPNSYISALGCNILNDKYIMSMLEPWVKSGGVIGKYTYYFLEYNKYTRTHYLHRDLSKSPRN